MLCADDAVTSRLEPWHWSHEESTVYLYEHTNMFLRKRLRYARPLQCCASSSVLIPYNLDV